MSENISTKLKISAEEVRVGVEEIFVERKVCEKFESFAEKV